MDYGLSPQQNLEQIQMLSPHDTVPSCAANALHGAL